MKKLLALVLAAAMALSVLAGCAGGNNSSANSSNSKPVISGEAGEAGWKKFDTKVKLEIPVYDRGDGSNGVKDVVNNYWTKWVQTEFGDKWNIEVTYVPITRSAVLATYANLAASDSLPTILAEYDYPKLTQWISDGYVKPYDVDYFKHVAPTYWQNMEDAGITQYTKVAGEDYLLLGSRAYGNSTYTYVTFYRQDWMDQVGVTEYPSTFAAWCDLYQKIVDAGIAEHPAGGTKITGAGVDQNHAYRTYPENELDWVMYGDYNIPALSTEWQKTLLKRENILFSKGYKDPEFYLKEGAEAMTDFVAGKAFSYSCYTSSNVQVLNDFYAQNPDGKLGVAVPNPAADDKDETGASNAGYRPGFSFGAMIAFAKDATDDEALAAMMYLEWLAKNLFEFQWGIEGKNFEYVDGVPTAKTDVPAEVQQGHNNNVDYWMLVAAIKTLGDIEKDIAAVTPQGVPQDFFADILAAYNAQQEIYKNGQAIEDCLFAVSIAAEAEYANTLYGKYEEYRTKLTLCDPAEFDKLYDELSAQYLKDGYQAVIDERKAAFEAGNATHIRK